ncbi:MAG: hypothetical protein AB7R89_30945 [Dehalococcoidia bacterium]
MIPHLLIPLVFVLIRTPTPLPEIPSRCWNCEGRRLVRLDGEIACCWCGATLEVIE